VTRMSRCVEMNPNLISIADLFSEEIRPILDRAEELKSRRDDLAVFTEVYQCPLGGAQMPASLPILELEDVAQ
jgi:hypothetical protein